MTLVISVLEQGLIYSLAALGIYITYRILDFPDLTVDGSFPLGAAIAAVMIMHGVPAIVTLPVSFLAGALSGLATGLIHVKLRVRDLLAGIIVMTALYTVNLRLMGKANLPLYTVKTVFDNKFVNSIPLKAAAPLRTTLVLLVIVLIIKALLDWYLKTRSGMVLRAAGSNPKIVTALGLDEGRIKIRGLMIANGLCAFSGCLFAQQQRYADVSMGTGTMVVALASVIIGISLLGRFRFPGITAAVIIGSVIYKACVAAAVHFLKNADDMKLITAVLFLIILVVSMDKKRKVAGQDA